MIKAVNKVLLLELVLVITTIICSQNDLSVYAAEEKHAIDGVVYELNSKSNYKFSAEDAIPADNADTFGELSVLGDFQDITELNGIPAYCIEVGNAAIEYTINLEKLNENAEGWHLTKDKTDEVNGINLDRKINRGVLILQSSLDGEKWTEEVIKTNVFTEKTDLTEAFYTTKDLQQENGCYYRIIVAYEMRRKIEDKHVLFVDLDNYEHKKVAEVYEFYVINEEMLDEDSTKATDTPRKELGSKVNTGKDNGFAGEKELEVDDPHYGWDLGTFFVNGYTRETKDDDGRPVFLKNVGDQVTLWFNLQQDIGCLNDDENLTIAEDKNGYDEHFEIEKTNFKHGALIVRYTDHEGKRHDPVIYTNFLSASSRTGADTRVKLFEEGDYEVTLDYEIKNNSRQIGPISVAPSYTNYKIYFEFSIRNGNCMVYPVDMITGNELADGAITENGFCLDMAKSRYLTIDVTKDTLKRADNGTIKADTRFSRPAQDGEMYTDEGIYTFTVRNLYTDGEPVTKTIYVGEDNILTALANSGLSLEDINEQILAEDTIREDESIIVSKKHNITHNK